MVREEEVRESVVEAESDMSPSVRASIEEVATHPSVVTVVRDEVAELAREPVPRKATW